MTIFFTSDLHLGHKNIIEMQKDDRPFDTIEEHDEEIIKRWNDKVTKNDKVFVLGDFCFPKASLRLAGRLNGYKHLILGNHDNHSSEDYLKYFNKLHGALDYKGYILTHIPIHRDQKYRYRKNIHGHLHAKNVMKIKRKNLGGQYNIYDGEVKDDFYINVSLEQHGLAPVSFDELGLICK